MFSEDVFQEVLIKTNIFILVVRLQKTSSRRLTQDQYFRLGHTSSRSFQDVFKTFLRCLQDVFKTSLRRLQVIFKASFQNVFKISCKNILKTTSRRLQVKLFLLTCLRDVFNTFLRRTASTVIYRRICLGHTFEKFMVSVENLQE